MKNRWPQRQTLEQEKRGGPRGTRVEGLYSLRVAIGKERGGFGIVRKWKIRKRSEVFNLVAVAKRLEVLVDGTLLLL